MTELYVLEKYVDPGIEWAREFRKRVEAESMLWEPPVLSLCFGWLWTLSWLGCSASKPYPFSDGSGPEWHFNDTKGAEATTIEDSLVIYRFWVQLDVGKSIYYVQDRKHENRCRPNYREREKELTELYGYSVDSEQRPHLKGWKPSG